jgi:predicted TIM-barrel fold metal-dependent hydrolase
MDQHMYERPDMWQVYCDPNKRHLAMTIEADDLGHWWLTNRWLGRRVSYAWISTPEDGFKGMSSGIELARAGLPSHVNYEDDLPGDYWDPIARVAKLDEFGIDATIIIPHWGCVWGNVRRGVYDNLAVVRANMEAWNRRAVDIQHDGGGHLLAVGQVSLRGGDQSWLEEQLRFLARGGVKAAMLGYGLSDGRTLSNPDHDRAWSAFVEHDIVPVFHVQDNGRNSGLAEEWFDTDHDPFASALEMPFFSVGIRLALGDLTLNGTLERFPDLRLCIIELYANWFQEFLEAIDHAYSFHCRVTGRHIRELKLKPSEYLLRQIRLVTHWSLDDVPDLVERYTDHMMFGGDYPHCEGLLSPFHEFSQRVGPLPEVATAKLYGGNAANLLRLSR